MAVIRWNPWNELFALHDQMDQLFGQSFGETGRREGGEYANLPVDIRQTDEAYYIEASVPGFRPDDVEVTIDDNVLTIAGRMSEERERTEGGYVRRERRRQSVYRQVGLPTEVRIDDVQARFEHGVLTITVPRAQKAHPKRIPVTAGGDAAKRVVEARPDHGS